MEKMYIVVINDTPIWAAFKSYNAAMESIAITYRGMNRPENITIKEVLVMPFADHL